jgi:NitT/TauT family transport system permease protein
MWAATRSTLINTAYGFLIGGGAAIGIGYLLATSPKVSDIVDPFITALYILPKIALVPLFVIWFGVGAQMQVATGAIVTFFFMFYNTFYGVREVDRELVNAMRIMGASRLTIGLKVRFPSALVWVVAGLKISVPQALVGVVVAEILASDNGLGYLLNSSAGQFNSAGTFAALLTLLIIGLAVDSLLNLMTKRALRWKTAGVH